MDAWNVLESGKNWGEADGELCEQLDFINSYVMHIQNLEKGKELTDAGAYPGTAGRAYPGTADRAGNTGGVKRFAERRP